MLIVSRRDAESIEIKPEEGIDPSMTLGDLFKNGPIEITIFSASGNRVKMGVQAPSQLAIWRKNAVPA
ncbi:MAG: carbon storage regulator [Woeseiaceae bacterium]|nr:carbon storage regulator [Woeseiaceae bacterium]MDJ0906003.1 carbon storage regulator [Woeseiaceae bacterium]